MNPEGNKILSLSMQRLAGEIAPILPTAFAQGQIGLIGMMLTLVANEYERGADLRANENKDIRKLFSELAHTVKDASLKARLETACGCRSEEHTSELQSRQYLVCRLLLEKKKQ